MFGIFDVWLIARVMWAFRPYLSYILRFPFTWQCVRVLDNIVLSTRTNLSLFIIRSILS